MGLRGELFSTRMACDGRTYFFNVKENRVGDLFLTIVESKPTETGDFDRRSVVVFQESAADFIKALSQSLEAMEKAAPSARAKPPRTKREAMAPRDDGRDELARLSPDERPRHYIETGKGRRPAADAKRPAADRPAGARPGSDRPSRGPNDDRRKRVVARDPSRPEGSASPADGKKARVLRVKAKAPMVPAVPEEKPRVRRVRVKKEE